MSSADGRPDPDRLLAQAREEERRAARGKLKIFLGAAPGVGKTYAMLEAARDARNAGVDVAVGVVETHGRAETTALLAGLEVLPRREVEYRGTRLAELDLDGALARHPALILVDELAHTNAPGLRHAKRWQDIDELLAAGIDVLTAVNVQHLESLNDVVAQITGVTVRERVPDAVLERADDVALVDVTPDVLQERLRQGKVYLPEAAGRALDRFFREGNLIALRELALRRTAERVDAEMRGYRRARGIDAIWPAGERLLVCVGANPAGARLIRSARRMAAGFGATWIAVHVETPGADRLPAADREALSANLALAAALGAETAVLSGADPSEEVLAYARRQNATRIVVGKPTHSRWRDRFRGSLLDDLVRGSGEIDVYVITGDAETGRPRLLPSPLPAVPARQYLTAIGWIVAATVAGLLLRPVLKTIDVAMLYLLAVVVVSARHPRGPAVAASLLSIALFDFCFVPPFYTFSVSDGGYLLTFAVMLLIALAMSRLTNRIRSQVLSARAREERTAALYALSRDLAGATDLRALVGAITARARETFTGAADVLVPGPQEELAWPDPAAEDADKELGVARWVLSHGSPAGAGTDTLPGARHLFVPLKGTGGAAAVLALSAAAAAWLRDTDRRRMLDSFAEQAGLAIERARLAEATRRSQVEVEAERLRTSLLSSLSHDLRTPLGAIEGAATTLLDGERSLTPEARRDLAQTVVEESRRMTRLVGNLLNMIRVETGSLEADREWQPLEEVVGVALIRLAEKLRHHPVTTDLPGDLPLVPIDGLLIEQVLVNLLENAAKYTPAGTPIEIRARADRDGVLLDVADRGAGIPPGEEERVFEKFHRARGAAPAGGVGLGLAICRGIIAAHGGRIWAEARPGGGAIFRVRIPVTGTPPAPPPEIEG
ncbi:MAG TPA: sensor histidine kinase KdpD [Gemmatimonadales bacterium]|nr:sensor histidine kinase KdpD [Gemmatimonadales bacterium]